MDVQLIADPESFLEHAGPFLEAERFTANVIAVQAQRVTTGQTAPIAGSLWAIVTDDSGEVAAVAMQTPPHFLFLPRMPTEAVTAIAERLAADERRLPGVTGELASVATFLGEWERRTGQVAERRKEMRFYVLGELRPPADIPGSPRRAVDRDEQLLVDWMYAFIAEADPDAPREDPSVMARRRIDHGEAWLWEVDGRVVSLAGVSQPAAGVSRVGPVYTPPADRGHGYGSAVTAVASRAGLDDGATAVVLYTDLSNPTSNKIYQAIGYVADHDSAEWTFE